MKQILLLFLFIFGISNISFAQLSLSFVAKGNYGLGNSQQAFLVQSNIENDPVSFEAIADLSLRSELRVRPSFEIGVEGGFPLNERINAIFGLNFQQVRVEAIPDLTNFPFLQIPVNSTLSQIYYLKIPLLLEVDLYKDKLFVQAGIYAASKIAYHHKELKRQSSNPLVTENTITNDRFLEINSSDQFNSLLFGFQTGIKYQFWKKFSVNMSYSHSLNNFFDEDTSLDMKLKHFSFGLQWRFI